MKIVFMSPYVPGKSFELGDPGFPSSGQSLIHPAASPNSYSLLQHDSTSRLGRRTKYPPTGSY